ncbi:unnamed protein product [Urochloa decumbens]|uniref:Uncharacterized protein n=1 Tax=Urochloa decumbens TaxID=240449 RepID=A0ABC9GRY1_9POAL
MESGHKSGGGSAAGGDGVLCHACGYHYPNGHPSAKQRRAHRKHCGKPASAAAAAEEGAGEHEGTESLPGDGRGGVGDDGIGASEAERGGSLPGSVPEPASAADGGDNAEHSSGNGTGHQVIGDKCAEDHLISSSNIPSELTSEASRTDDDTLTTVVTQYSEKGTPIEDGDPSEQLEDAPTSLLLPEPEDGAKCSSEISENEKQNSLPEYETQNSTVMPLESNATGVGTSEQMEDVVTQVDGIAVTEEDDTVDTIGKNSTVVPLESNATEVGTSEQTDDVVSQVDGIAATEEDDTVDTIGKNSTVVLLESNATGGGTSEQTDDVVSQVDGIAVTEEDDTVDTIGKNEFSESCQDNLQTKIGEGHSSTVVEEDSSSSDKNLNETEPNQQSKHALTDSFEKNPNIEIPVGPSTDKSLGTDDDLLKHGTGVSLSEIAGNVKPQQQPDSTYETAGHLAVSEGADNVDEQHHAISEGSIPAVSNAFEPAVTENVCSSGVTIDDSIQKNATGGTVMTSQVDLVELSTSAMSHEINTLANDVDEEGQNEKGGTDLTSCGGNELHIIENFEENQQNREVIVDPTHEIDTVSSTDNHEESEQSKEVIADTSSCKISAVQSMTRAEEKEQIEEFIVNLTSEETIVPSSRDIVEEKQGGVDVKTTGEIDGAHSIETAGENNATTCEINAGITTDDVEDMVQNEEITTGPVSHGISMACSSSNEEKIHKEEVAECLGSHENIVVHGTEHVEEKTIDEATVDAASHKFSLATSTDSVEERKGEETTADPILHERSAVLTTDNIDEKKNEEPILDPTTSSATICSIDNVEEKKLSEETTADPSSGESNMLPATGDAEKKKQNGDTTTDPASDKTEAAESTNVVEEIGKTEETASKEISTIESTDDMKRTVDQNEEIADKEMVIDSDKNHVSLKVLLADKNVETKEKEKKASTKDRVLSFRRRTSKDNVSPVKPGSPKAGSGQQDWNSPARLPVEKKPKGRKQQWVPFICCSSVQ